MNGTVINKFLAVLKLTEISRQYLLLRTDILQSFYRKQSLGALDLRDYEGRISQTDEIGSHLQTTII